MKNIFYSFFALLFNLCRVFPVKENSAVFLAPHRGGSRDSLAELAAYTEKTGKYRVTRLSSAFDGIGGAVRFFLRGPIILARAKYIFLNDNFMPLSSMNISSRTVITQLWHAEGAFKKFGLMTDLEPGVRERELKAAEKLTYIVCSSENVRQVYAEAFGVPVKKTVALGSPRTDRLLSGEGRSEAADAFFKAHPELRGKKLVLYAPTFRDSPEDDAALLSHFDFERFDAEYGNEYALLVKLHPQVHSPAPCGAFTDVTDGDISDLTLICDLLITDYSSVCMDFALLDKPCLFYAYDLEEYGASRSFCFGYEDYVPGTAARDFDSLIEAMKNPRSYEKIKRFREFNFDYTDARSTKRVAEFVFGR